MYSREPSNNAKAGNDDEEDAFDKEFKVGNPPGRFTCHLLGNIQDNYNMEIHTIIVVLHGSWETLFIIDL